MRAINVLLIVASVVSFSCATTTSQVNPKALGCQRDTQCKADRICEQNTCVYPVRKAEVDATMVGVEKAEAKRKVRPNKPGEGGDPIACEQGDAVECYNLGMAKAFGVGVSKDEGDARAYFQKACRGGHTFGCVNLLFLLEKKNGAKEGGAKSEYQKVQDIEIYRKSCDSEDAEACFLAARFLDHTLLDDIPKDLGQAREYYTKACEKDHAASCAAAAKMYGGGLGGAKDAAKSKEYYRKACDLGETASCDVGKKGKKQ